MFRDRRDAGRRLGQALQHYAETNPLVLAIPKGGIEVGLEVARALDAGFSIAVARKLPFPDYPEAGFGAVAEDGTTVLASDAEQHVVRAEIARIAAEQKEEIARRIRILRKGEPLPPIKGRTVILVDDGIATGATMRAALLMCRNRGADRLVAGAPVSSLTFEQTVKGEVDEVIILEEPAVFRAVAQVYENWYDVDDDEARRLLDQWHDEKHAGKNDDY